MKIAATKVFADFVNKTAAETGKRFHAYPVKLSEREYNFLAGDSWDAVYYGDFIGGAFRAICITYPANYYACSRYVSTKELCNEFRRRGVRDVAGLREMIVDLFEI